MKGLLPGTFQPFPCSETDYGVKEQFQNESLIGKQWRVWGQSLLL